jgi:hypothetical protein
MGLALGSNEVGGSTGSAFGIWRGWTRFAAAAESGGLMGWANEGITVFSLMKHRPVTTTGRMQDQYFLWAWPKT